MDDAEAGFAQLYSSPHPPLSWVNMAPPAEIVDGVKTFIPLGTYINIHLDAITHHPQKTTQKY